MSTNRFGGTSTIVDDHARESTLENIESTLNGTLNVSGSIDVGLPVLKLMILTSPHNLHHYMFKNYYQLI